MKQMPNRKQLNAMSREKRRYWLDRIAKRHSPLRPYEVGFAAARGFTSLRARLPRTLRDMAAQ